MSKVSLYDVLSFAWGFYGKKPKSLPTIFATGYSGILLTVAKNYFSQQELTEENFFKIKKLDEINTPGVMLKAGTRAAATTFLGYSTRKLYNKLTHKSL